MLRKITLCREVIRDQLIPNAVSWYTGEAGEDEDDEDEVGLPASYPVQPSLER